MTYYFNKYATKCHHYLIQLIKARLLGTLSLFIQFPPHESCLSYLFDFPMNRSDIDPQ
jgi:hypothetical protein